MSATEASRSFAALLDRVEAGETVVITRGGQRVAAIGPTAGGNGRAVLDLLGSGEVDSDFAADVDAVRAGVTTGGTAWERG